MKTLLQLDIDSNFDKSMYSISKTSFKALTQPPKDYRFDCMYINPKQDAIKFMTLMLQSYMTLFYKFQKQRRKSSINSQYFQIGVVKKIMLNCSQMQSRTFNSLKDRKWKQVISRSSMTVYTTTTKRNGISNINLLLYRKENKKK